MVPCMNTPPDLTWTLGDRMRKALTVSGITSTEIADTLDVAPETVSIWLNDHRQPSRATLMAWASITGVPLSWLLPRLDSNQQPSGYRPTEAAS
jgi:transcriptional regulator with XRE-family HTH domain